MINILCEIDPFLSEHLGLKFNHDGRKHSAAPRVSQRLSAGVYYPGNHSPLVAYCFIDQGCPQIVILVILSLVSVLGMLGNGVVIWVTGFKMKKTVNTIWYLNLAVADFIVTASLPLRITSIALDYHWPFGTFMCKMDGAVFYLNMYVNVYTLVVISFEKLQWDSDELHCSVRKGSWVSLGVWVLALALSSPYFIIGVTGPPDHDKDIIWCFDDFSLPGDDQHTTAELLQFRANRFTALIVTRVILGFAVPFAAIVCFYFVLIIQLCSSDCSLGSQIGRRFKITAAVIAAFFLCWAPSQIIDVIDSVNVLATEFSETLHHVVTIGGPITVCLTLLNSCLKPLLYVFMGQGFREVFRSSVLKVMEKAMAEELP